MIRKALLAVAGASLAQTASAEIRETAPGRYVCDAPAGHFSRVDVSDFFGPGTTMAARIKFVSGYPDERWKPSANLVFVLDNEEGASVGLYVPPENDDNVWVTLKAPGAQQGYAMAIRRRASPVEISATMARGAVFARAGNERGQINVEGRTLSGRAISCSSGRFEIELTRNPRPPRRL